MRQNMFKEDAVKVINIKAGGTPSTPLHVVFKSQSIHHMQRRDFVKLLLDNGADPTLPDADRHSSLDLARKAGDH